MATLAQIPPDTKNLSVNLIHDCRWWLDASANQGGRQVIVCHEFGFGIKNNTPVRGFLIQVAIKTDAEAAAPFQEMLGCSWAE